MSKNKNEKENYLESTEKEVVSTEKEESASDTPFDDKLLNFLNLMSLGKSKSEAIKICRFTKEELTKI